MYIPGQKRKKKRKQKHKERERETGGQTQKLSGKDSWDGSGSPFHPRSRAGVAGGWKPHLLCPCHFQQQPPSPSACWETYGEESVIPRFQDKERTRQVGDDGFIDV